MEKGIIAILSMEEFKKTKYSVSVRKEQTIEKLISQIKSEYKNIDISLVKAFYFECEKQISEVEKILRKLLVQAFGPYQPENHWELYSNSEGNEFIEYIENLVKFSNNINKIEIKYN